ncbi:DUF3558 domain-containing protein [Nocardia puris]|uniref:DUF3558 domain-containing protein n=1 Tax=Nocardia puris TaxID=208602 RepID=UPI001895CAE3|nr:DUF3558 domain-containing protein [Nocardia puris]MBF6211088.1 DUF3558 domain-containing protein [Nocardia puris]
MRTAHALRTAITVGATLALATACGVEFGERADSTSTTPTLAMDHLLNPCTDIPDEWLIETGLDPSSEPDSVNPAEPSAWRVCGWRSVDKPYRVDVMSSSRTFEETRANPNIVVLRETTVGSRRALVSRIISDTIEESCYVAFPAEREMFTVAVGWYATHPMIEDRCELAVKHAADLERRLPR